MIRRTLEGLVSRSWKLICETAIEHSPKSPAATTAYLRKIALSLGLPVPETVRVESRR